MTENFVKSLDRNPFQGDGLLVDKIQEKHCANPVECRKISGWYLSSVYNTVTKKRISIIEDALDFDHVVDATNTSNGSHVWQCSMRVTTRLRGLTKAHHLP